MELKNIDVINNFTELEELEIIGINNNLNLNSLLSCDKIKSLSLSFSERANDTSFDLLLKNCKLLEALELGRISNNLNIRGEILDIDGLNGLNSLKSISLDNINISGVKNKVFID